MKEDKDRRIYLYLWIAFLVKKKAFFHAVPTLQDSRPFNWTVARGTRHEQKKP